MNRLLKKEIKEKVVPAKVMSSRLWQLTIQYCRILERAEKLDAKDIPAGDAKKILRIEDELRERLVKAIGHDPYPPDRIEKEAPSNYMISLLPKNKPEEKPVEKLGPKLNFKVKIISSIGATVATFNAKVDSKNGAITEALSKMKQLGLKKATYKIS